MATMNDAKPDPSPPMTREERLAANLRENLHRRKAQSRALDSQAEQEASNRPKT